MRWFIQSLSAKISRIATRYIPDPLVIALLLSALILGWSTLKSDLGLLGSIDTWGGVQGQAGLWRLLGFAMQMCLVLVTGHALASAPPAQRAIKRITGLVMSPTQAVVMTALRRGPRS